MSDINLKTSQETFFQRLNFINENHDHWVISALIISLFTLPFGFMTFKGLFGYLSSICLILSVAALLIAPKKPIQFYQTKYSLLITAGLSAITMVTVLTQLLQGHLILSAYDGPIRLLIALPILIAIYQLKIDFSKILSCTLPLVLLVIFSLGRVDVPPWGDRLTSPYLDPIFWGNFSMIIGFMCFVSIQTQDHSWFKLYKFSGLLLGGAMSLFSQSRAGWVAAIVMAFVWLILNRKTISFKKVVFIILSFFIILLTLYLFVDMVKFRIDLAITEALHWYTNTQSVSSVGIRLTMWKISLYLFSLNPWLGYGDFSALPIMHDVYIASFADPESIRTIQCCGPHNEIAAHAIKTGIFGICALLATYLIPIYVFLRHKNSPSTMMGMMLCVGVFTCGFATEMLSLKIGYTFFAIMTSGLLATTLWQGFINHE